MADWEENMNLQPMAYHPGVNRNPGGNISDRYHSVEFTITENKILYQFKLRNSASQSLFILVKEGSEMLHRLKEGSVFKTKYYTTDSLRPVSSETRIKTITRDDHGRFKGHYLIGLDILSQNESRSLH
jgi:hypothetical protein